MIYRPRLIPDTKATVARWRGLFRESFNEDPVLIMAQGLAMRTRRNSASTAPSSFRRTRWR